MKFAVYTKLVGMGLRAQYSIAAVVDAKSIEEAVESFRKAEDMPRPVKMDHNTFRASHWEIGARKATAYEVENFRVIRGPHTPENMDVAEHNLPIIARGLPQTI